MLEFLPALVVILDVVILVFSLARLWTKRFLHVPEWLMALVLILQTGIMLLPDNLNHLKEGRVPDALGLCGGLLLFGLFVFGLRLKEKSLPAFGVPLVTFLHVLWMASPQNTAGAIESPMFSLVHVVLLVVALVLFLVAGLFALLYLLQAKALRRKRPTMLSLPSLERSQRFSFLTLYLGYPMLTVGVVLGLLKGKESGPAPGDLVVLATGGLWLFFAALIGYRISTKASGKHMAWCVFIGALAVVGILLALHWHGNK